MKPKKIKHLAKSSAIKGIGQPMLDLGIEKAREEDGIGMGVLSDGTPYLNQRGLAALCGVQNAHIGTISKDWVDPEAESKPRITRIKEILAKSAGGRPVAHYEVQHSGTTHYCYPADVCLAVLEYYAFDAGTNCQTEARDNYRLLAGSKLRDMIYIRVGYDPSAFGEHRFDKWHERLALNHQSAPRGYFSVFNEAGTIIYEMIQAGAPIGDKVVPDISIGGYWSRYWEDNNLSFQFGERQKFPHRYPESHPQSKSNPQIAWCYPIVALGAYRAWLQDVYIGDGKFGKYIRGKARDGAFPPSVAELAIKTIEPPKIAP